MDKFTVFYLIVVSLIFLGWSSFKIRKELGKKEAIFWIVAMIIWFSLISIVFFIFLKFLPSKLN